MNDGSPTSLSTGQRLHPAGLLAGFVGGLPQLLFPGAAAVYGTRSSDLGALPVIAGVLLLSLAFRWLSWLRFRYITGPDDVRIEHGLISRSARSIPYDRIQDVSVEQRPLARLLGIAEVRFDTGGGSGDEASLAFVALAEAERLRELVRARKADEVIEAALGETAEPLPSTPVFAMDARRLVTLGFYSFSLVIFAVLGGAAQQFDFLLPFGWSDLAQLWDTAEQRGVDLTQFSRSAQLGGAALVLAALVAIGIVTGIVRTVLAEYGFRLDRTPMGFRRRRGLLTRSDVVIPVARVQAARITTGPLRKRCGWYALHLVSLGGEGSGEADHVVAPLARLDELWPIIAAARLAPPAADQAFHRARSGAWIDAWLLAMGAAAVAGTSLWAITALPGWWIVLAGPALMTLVAVPRWLGWWRTRYAVDAEQLYARHGWWRQQQLIARQVNVHSVSLTQGPLLRRRRLANLDFGIAGAALTFHAVPLEIAQAIREQVLALAAPLDFSEL